VERSRGLSIGLFWSFEIGVWNLFGVWKLGFRIFVLQWRTKFLPDIIDSLKHGEVGENGQNPENGLHALEEGACGEEDDAFGSLHEPDIAWDLQGLCLGSNIRDQDGAHTDKRSEDDDIRFSFFQVVEEDGKKKKEIRISIQD